MEVLEQPIAVRPAATAPGLRAARRSLRGQIAKLEQEPAHAAKRALIDAMLSEPARHKWVRVTNEDIGEPGCKHWHVRPASD